MLDSFVRKDEWMSVIIRTVTVNVNDLGGIGGIGIERCLAPAHDRRDARARHATLEHNCGPL